MFPGDEGGDASPHDRLLFHVLEIQAEAVNHLAAINQALVQKLDTPRSRREAATAAEKPEHRYLPQNPKWRIWSSFRAEMQRLEKIVRRDNHLGPDGLVTEEAMYAAGGPHPRTGLRIRVKSYGLRPDQWPPSTWPAELSGQNSDLS
jgi:hypothetical protein